MPDPIVEQACPSYAVAVDIALAERAIRAAFLEAAKVARQSSWGCDCLETGSDHPFLRLDSETPRHWGSCGRSIATRLEEIARA